MTQATTFAKKLLAKKWVEITSKELYALVSLLIWLIYVLRQTNFGQSLEVSVALATGASVLARTLYDAFLKSMTTQEDSK